ncbi:hypothetical protein FB451DRAFT_1561496 [Mycena latifolia]|nr:hypothetical protein FB451DRAFT_1561496 [Mycena latifolia]
MADTAARTPSPAPANDTALLFTTPISSSDLLHDTAGFTSQTPLSPLQPCRMTLANQPLSLFNNPAHNSSFACALAANAAPLKKVQEALEVSEVQEVLEVSKVPTAPLHHPLAGSGRQGPIQSPPGYNSAAGLPSNWPCIVA